MSAPTWLLDAESWPLPLWIAHRGAGKLAPENTLAAFREGARHGYRAFECDVKLSADDVPFLLHDATLERTTPERGIASQRSWSELSRIDAGGWHSRSFAGEPLPSLVAIAAWLQRNGHGLDLEIKPTPGDEERTGQLVAAEVARLWAGQARPPLLSSFRPEALRGAQTTAPQLPRALLLDSLWSGWWDVVQSLGCVAVITNYGLMDAALIQRLHDAGLRALVYTVNDPAEATRLLALGIDGIITDAVDRLAPVEAEQGLLD
ncbi:MAG: glycerophosphodiester phosphodiesterase [Burkholderiales bacterium PBB6]|nr:MAG: glycerophosphodiester phosphodiesterase [Burkholderiales bacterium PBB6]